MATKTYADGIRERSNSWQIRKTVKLPEGGSIRIEQTLGNKDVMTRMQATEKAIKLITKVQEQGKPALQSFERSYAMLGHNRMSLGSVIADYVELGKTKGTKNTNNKPWRKGSIDLYEADIKGRWEELLHYDISTIDPELIKGWYLRNMEEHAPATENAFRRSQTVFKYAIGEGLIQTNPCQMMALSNRRYVIGKKDRRLSIMRNDVGKFALSILNHKVKQRKKLDQTSLDAIIVMFFTGRRKSEIFNLRWEWFSDVKQFRYFVIPAEFVSDDFQGAKTRTDYYIACCEFLQKLFQMRYLQRENTCKLLGHDGAMEFVFPNRKRKDRGITDVDGRIKLITDHAGLGHYSPHDFKRTFTDIVLQNADLKPHHVKYITSHKDNDITFGRYGNSNEADRLQIHKGFQFVENFISKSMPFDFVDLEGKEHTYSGTKEVALNNEEIIDRRVADKNSFSIEYFNRYTTLKEPPIKVPDEIRKINAEIRKQYPMKDPVNLEDFVEGSDRSLFFEIEGKQKEGIDLFKKLNKTKEGTKEYNTIIAELKNHLADMLPKVKHFSKVLKTVMYDSERTIEAETKGMQPKEIKTYKAERLKHLNKTYERFQQMAKLTEVLEENLSDKEYIGKAVDPKDPDVLGIRPDGKIANMQNVKAYDKDGNELEPDPDVPFEFDKRVVSIVNEVEKPKKK